MSNRVVEFFKGRKDEPPTPTVPRSYFLGVEGVLTPTSSTERSQLIGRFKEEFTKAEYGGKVNPEIRWDDSGIYDLALVIETKELDGPGFREGVIKNIADAISKITRTLPPRHPWRKTEPRISLELDPNPERGAPRFHVG